jgi:hypothetical protein
MMSDKSENTSHLKSQTMKQLILFAAVILCARTISFSQMNAAKVQKIDGIEVYILNEPMRRYKIITEKASYVQPITILSKGRKDESIEEKVSSLVRKIKRTSQHQNLSLDAVMYTHGRGAFGIHFTDTTDGDKAGLAIVQKINNVQVYILAEPVAAFSVEGSRKSLFKLKSVSTYGLINNTIEEDVARFVSRLAKKYSIDGLIYNTGKSAIGIRVRQNTSISGTYRGIAEGLL